MSIQTDLSSAPYYDDFSEAKNYYKILFRPGVAVQTRELNQLQTLLQNQIERFGDNIFQQGTIIDGCEITFHKNVPYVKLKDLEADGSRAVVANFLNAFVRNSANLVGQIIDVSSGYEAREDKNTLFINYLNSGVDSNTTAFSADDTLTIYSPSYPINKINIINGSLGFSNTDTVVILSAIALQNTTGGSDLGTVPNVGDIITNTLIANAEIVSVNTTANSSAVILRVKPLDTDLASPSSNSQWWTFSANDTFTVNSGAVGVISEVIGSGADGVIRTSGAGTVLSIPITSSGSGYYVDPSVYIKSSTATSGQISSLDLTPQAFIGRAVVTDATTTPVGMGYGVTINGGVIYQKGYFVRVNPQLLIVNAYSNQPNNVVVGFRTNESIINSNIDTNLLDNSLGTPNSTAPGADRLKLEGILVVENKPDVVNDTEFLSIIEFSGGEPYIQRKQTQYDVITNELAKRTYEESGNYVIDPFLVTTRSENTFADEANTFLLNIDPGIAYLNGRRIETSSNYNLSVQKGTETSTNDVVVSLGYGSYIRVNEVGGLFKFNTGDIVNLYSSTKKYISQYPDVIPSAPTGLIGKARIRSFVLESGIPGSPSAIYRLYLFDINMDAGKSLISVRGVFYDGTYKAVADIVTSADPSTGATICQLYDSAINTQVHSAGIKAIKNITSGTYIYRTVDESLTANTTGYVSFNLVDGTFPYTGQLTTFQEKEVVVVPLEEGYASFNLTGNFVVSTSSNVMTGTGTSFLTEVQVGDWLRVSNNAGALFTTVQVASIANSTYATLTSNAAAAVSGTSTGTIVFPKYIPIPFDRTTRSIIVSANQTQMTANLGLALTSDMDVSIAYNVSSAPTAVAKTVLRDRYARVKSSNNAANTVGPWALGVTDVIRLKKVYVANGASNTLTINATSTSVDAVNDFIIYPNHRFSDGDSILYVGGTYTIPGLSNNSSYWVYAANSSGFQLTSDNTSPLAINAIATNDINHTLTGSPLYFNPNTYGVQDYTNDFYIDQNQNENYYNTAYLYQVPTPSRAITNNDVVLVQYDLLTHTASGGMKHVGSYNINDSLALSNSVSTINTIEIPSFYTTDGRYYDLRDSVDFRPTVVSTANTSANTWTGWTVNPTEPSFTSKFGNTELYFPAPESSFAGNVEYYLGRIDRVIITANGGFDVVKGAADLKPEAPAEPQSTLSLNLINIPPYPSYPVALSAESLIFANAKIANEKYTIKRWTDYTISSLFKDSDFLQEQPRAYTMSDIGSLDRRIRDLEYYVALSQVESKVRDRTIPSAIDPALERFKYGFFVDNFQDSTYSEVQHPEYNASVLSGELVPKFEEFRLDLRFNTANSNINALTAGGKYIALPYEEYPLIFQSLATQIPPPPVPVPTPVTPTPTPTPTPVTPTPTPVVPTCVEEIIQKTNSVDIVNRGTTWSGDGSVYEDWTFTMSNTAGACEVYMNCCDNDTAMVVYQSTSSTFNVSSITTSTQFATPNIASTNDVKQGGKAYLVGGRARWENDTGFRNGGPPDAGGKWIEDSYKLTWSHDPAKGKYYTIRVFKGGHLISPSLDAPRGTYAFRLYYPSDEIRVTCSNGSVTTTGTSLAVTPAAAPTAIVVQPPVRLSYNGQASWKPNYGYRVSNMPYSRNVLLRAFIYYYYTIQTLDVVITSLKPNTVHDVYIYGMNVSAMGRVRQTGGNSNILRADENGVLKFTIDAWFYNSDPRSLGIGYPFGPTTGYNYNFSTGEIRVTNADGTSTAAFTPQDASSKYVLQRAQFGRVY